MPQHLAERLISWASVLEPDTLAQAQRTASMPFVFPHLALMPDAHLGKGATVGSVIPTLDAIMPAAVGVDIGCAPSSPSVSSPAAICASFGSRSRRPSRCRPASATPR